jgi:hypothetical protein
MHDATAFAGIVCRSMVIGSIERQRAILKALLNPEIRSMAALVA